MLYRHLTYFEVWIRAFDRLMDAAPKLVTVPWLYSGELTLGTYMQIKTAFEQVQGRMSTIAHRWTEINYLRSVARRLRELEAELERALPDDLEGGFVTWGAGRIGALMLDTAEFVDVPSCYDIPSHFDFFSPSQLQRPQSSWARSSGRSSRLDPNGLNYVASAPMEWGFDGHHLGPGSYTSPLAKSGSVVLSRTVGLSSVSQRGRMLVSRH